MPFYADLHVHSRYARATSRNAELVELALWARRKGIAVLGTGDFTHPAWFGELQEGLVPAEPGLLRLRDDLDRAVVERLPRSCREPLRFLLQVEVSTAFHRDGGARRMHQLLYVPDLKTAATLNDRLGRRGNITEDGRPTLAMDASELLEVTLDSGDGAYLVPAHLWTPWVGVLSATSGFDSIEDCYGELSRHIFAVETGLSSDPPMNWRVSRLDRFRIVSYSDAHAPSRLGREATELDTELDYVAIRHALETGEGFQGTVELFPEEGRYYLSGHRRCGVRLEPDEARRAGLRCPVCGKRLTMGVLQRVEDLADRPAGARPDGVPGCRNLLPLDELVAEVAGVGRTSKTVRRTVDAMIERLGPELPILERLPLDAIEQAGFPEVAEAIGKVRRGQVVRVPGFDGEYGSIRPASEITSAPEAVR
ncbi:MAG TPA: endonuclease Q family protein [Actinomycetes bacterium]|nr:endonuclease Q family protein [Actinomycetes bacterium]HEX2160154.1 endonuclease Q family protein [Actinomycetes bacterium]